MEKDKNAGNKIPDITGDVVVGNQEVTDSALENVVGGVASLPKATVAKAKAGCNCPKIVPTSMPNSSYSPIEQ